MALTADGKSAPLTGSKSSDLESIIDGLDPELLEAMKDQHILLDVKDLRNLSSRISTAIYNSKKEELIKPLRTQLNFRVPESLINNKIESAETIKKDILFYKKAYEDEAASINKIIDSTNTLNNQLQEPLKGIKRTLKQYQEDFKENVKNINSSYVNKKKGIDDANIISNKEEEKKDFESKVSEIKNEFNSYQKKSINFFDILSKITSEISEDINEFIKSFDELTNSVNALKKGITDGFTYFENCTPEFEDLEDEERIKQSMILIRDPLTKLTVLISDSEERLKKAPGVLIEHKQKKGLAKDMIMICEELKEKAKSIAEKINQARLKVNLSEISYKEINIEPPKIGEIEKNIGDMKEKIKETNETNSIIKQKVMKKIEDDINKTRLDILFVIDSTNSTNTHLESIKNNFNNMISNIYKACPTASIFIGFIGYTDFLELDLGEEYIDIDFTGKKEEIYEKIRNLYPHGGGDDAEDLAGAFDMALKKTWKGFSRFAILATDAPCHGKEFHSKEVTDNFPEGDREKRDIKELVKKLAEHKISLFCVKISDITDQMFNIFRKCYEQGKVKDSTSEFTVESCENICETIIQKACDIYKSKKI